MNSKLFRWSTGLLVFLIVLLPIGIAQAQTLINLPPDDMFQLPWQQGEAWIALDGLDNGSIRDKSSPHNYQMGGAVDFTPHKDVFVGIDTSNFWITAAAAGTVTEQYRCYLKINHGNGWVTEYWHLSNIQVSRGQAVYRNQRLGIIADNIQIQSCTGNTNPYPHLHFILRPEMRNVTFAGWLLEYNSLYNRTTFTKNGDSKATWSYEPILNIPNLQIALRDPITWDIAYIGTLDAYRYERWPFTLSATEKFTLISYGTTPGLTPLLVLIDANGTELARGVGTLTSTQPAGSYFVQVQPESGQGFYRIAMQRNELPDGPSAGIVIPPTINVGETLSGSASLNDIPPGGYTSVEFTCKYPVALISISGITPTDLFGINPAVAVNGPADGNMIVAIAGTNGQRAMTGGPAFTFNLTGLTAGQGEISCQTRVSTGDGALVAIDAISASVSVLGSGDGQPSDLTDPGDILTGSVINGQVLAARQVTVGLYDVTNTLIVSTVTSPDGAFSLSAQPGTYTAVASALGYLNAQGSVTLTEGQTITKTTISLPAGDIDGNGVIDQYDAITVAMNYNTASPAAADLNNDGIINLLDLEALAANYRASGALDWP